MTRHFSCVLLRCANGPLQLFDHVVDGDEFFAVEVAAAFGELLVFEVETGGACSGVFDDGAADELGFSKASVGVGEDGEAAGVGCFANAAGEVFEAEEADVGDSGGDAGCGA